MSIRTVLPIPGFPYYLAGDDGTIWTTRRKGGNDRGAGRASSPRLMKTTPDARGYIQVSLDLDGVVITRKVHALILETFVGPRPTGYEACHFPDTAPSNNRLNNLRWDTHQENIRDRFRGRSSSRKKCTKCEINKPLNNFYFDKRSSDGRQSQCKKCHNQVAVATRDADKKRQSNREYMRRYRAGIAS